MVAHDNNGTVRLGTRSNFDQTYSVHAECLQSVCRARLLLYLGPRVATETALRRRRAVHLHLNFPHRDAAICIAEDPDGQFVLCGSDLHSIRIFR